MNRTVGQTRLLILLLCAGVALSLAQGRHWGDAALHGPNGILARGMAGHSEKGPALEKQQVDWANARPTFQGSVASAGNGATPSAGEQAEPVVFDQPFRLQAGLLRAHLGRAPPHTFSL
jgi:hypothetical protein